MSDKELVTVVATGEGFDGTALRHEGEKFQMPKDAVDKGASWFVRAEDAGKEAKVSNGPTAADVIKSLPGLSDEDLAKLEVSEDDREGGARVSVIKAIGAEQKKRAEAKEAGAGAGGDANALA